MQNAKNLDLLRFLPKSIDDNKDTQERQTKRAGTLDAYHTAI